MNLLSIAIILFLILELLNVFLLYFTPETTRGNGLGVFNAYEKSKSDPAVHSLVKYLINWVAGTKLIFIALLIVVLATGNATVKIWSVLALIISISTFYWRLYPAIKRIDANNGLCPKGYSKTLGLMIAGFMAVFMIVLVLSFIL